MIDDAKYCIIGNRKKEFSLNITYLLIIALTTIRLSFNDVRRSFSVFNRLNMKPIIILSKGRV